MTTQTSKITVGAMVAVAVIGAFLLGKATGGNVPIDDLGGQRAGLQEFVDGIKVGSQNTQWYSVDLAPLEDQRVVWRNTTGKTVFVDAGDWSFVTGTASSSQKISLFATTTSEVPNTHDFTALTATSTALLDSYVVATSSGATTTSSVLAAIQSKGNGQVIVPDGWYVIGYVQTNSTVGCSNTGACESATSSKRGFNPTFRIRVHY